MSKEIRVVGNWKMNKKVGETLSFIQSLPPLLKVAYLAIPYTAIYAACAQKIPLLAIGAQNMHDDPFGPYTGEISGEMLRDIGAEFVILGHSERRHYFNETNDFINRKIKHALVTNLVPILCIGETALERDNNQTLEVLTKQLSESLFEIESAHLEAMMIAYEPVWAIGTGKPATAQMAQKTHFELRKLINQQWGPQVAEKIYILYGGSISADNIADFVKQPDIDGVLVGGASLNSASFTQLLQIVGNIKT